MLRLRNVGLVTILVLTSSGLVAQQTSKSGPPVPEIPEVRTSGVASIPVRANLATVTFEFSARGRTPRAAGKATAARANAIRRALIAVGIPRDSLPTGGQWGWWGSRARLEPGPYGRDTSYVVTDVFTARIRDLTLIGRAIDTALVEGASSVSNVQFGATDTDREYVRGLGDATRRARENAAAMAEAEGGALGRAIELNTQAMRDDYYSPFDLRSSQVTSAASWESSSIVVPELKVTVTVYGRWELLPKRGTTDKESR
jgi:uncharacterized protein